MNKTLIAFWNLDFTKRRRENVQRRIRNQYRCEPIGKGNKAWKRLEREQRADAWKTVTWPI